MHLSFNVIGTAVWLTVFSVVKAIFHPVFSLSASPAGIAVAHSAFNLLCVMLLMPMASLLEKLALRVIRDDEVPRKRTKA